MNAEPGHGRPAQRAAAVRRIRPAALRALRAARRRTQATCDVHGVEPRPRVPTYLVFLGDCDGPADDAAGRVRASAPGRAARASSRTAKASTPAPTCSPGCARTTCRSAASFVNRIGRTVRQVREESALQRALAARVPRGRSPRRAMPQRVRRELAAFVGGEVGAGRLALTPPEPTPLGWQLRKLANLRSPCRWSASSLLPLPDRRARRSSSVMLRTREERDPEICPRPDRAADARAAASSKTTTSPTSSRRSARSSRGCSGAGC